MTDIYKTFLINLEKDVDRLTFMSHQLETLNISFEKVEAVYGKDYLENGGGEYNEDYSLKKNGYKLSPGAIGCALSHKKVFNKILKEEKYKDINYFLILEDDVELSKNFKKILENILKKEIQSTKKTFEYLQFDYPKTTILFLPLSIYECILSVIKNKDFKKTFIILKNIFLKLYTILKRMFIQNFFVGIYKDVQNNTGAYIISRDGAEKIFKANDPYILNAIDFAIIQITNEYDLKSYYYSPCIAFQKKEVFNSHIDLGTKKDNLGRTILEKKWYTRW